MAIVWLVLNIVCWFCFYDRAPSTTVGPVTNGSLKHKYTRSDHPLQEEKEQKISFKTYRDQYIRIEMFVLFLATFITYFNQTALETIVAAFTEKHFHWTIVHTSILFAFAGLEIIVVYVSLVKFFSKRFEDRMLLIFGFISLTLACILGTFFTWASYSFDWGDYSSTGVVNKRLLTMFIIFVILDLLGLPFIAATSVSLFTKLTNKDLQGFSQGIQRFMMGIGTIGKRIEVF
jgi:ceroid-lipofuscinosis MFS transporter 7